jgi:DNA-binding response OmpR family regulator
MTDSESNNTQSSNLTKVLVAEDNAVVLKGLHNFLRKWGYEPVKAIDGSEAWELLEKDNDIHLAILDWNLPGLTGVEICKKLRQRSSGPYVYTIMFSVRKSNEEQIEALDSGADDYVVKPCKPSLLYAKLAAACRILRMAANIKLPDAKPPATSD